MLFSSWQRYGKGFASAAGRRTAIILGAALILTMGIGSVRADTFTAGNAGALISAINSANKVGGSHTIVLASGRTFDLKSANNTIDGANGLPVIGSTRAVDLTIIGNGATIRRIQAFNRYNQAINTFRLFNVNPAASLTLEDATLEGGWAYELGVAGYGGAIYNQGTLTVNSSTFFLNNAVNGGVIYNTGGMVTVSGSMLFGNLAFHFSYSSPTGGGDGGGIYNDPDGMVVVENVSAITENTADLLGDDVYNLGLLYLDWTSTIGILDGNPPIPF